MSTQISLTEGLKLTALQQYHPRIDIELWSLEQEEYENNNYRFQNEISSISKDEIMSLIDEEEEHEPCSWVDLIPTPDMTIYKDNIYQESSTEEIRWDINAIPRKTYWVFFQEKTYPINVSFYLDESDTHPIWENTLDIESSKQYSKYTIFDEDFLACYDDESEDAVSIEDIACIGVEIPEKVAYLGETDDGIILTDDSKIRLSKETMPEKILFCCTTKGEKKIQVMFYAKNHLHPNERPVFITASNLDIKILDNSDRLSLPIIQQENINLKIIERDIYSLLSATARTEYSKYIGRDYNNIVFTPRNDNQTIIPYEYRNGVFYLRLPYFCKTISMHLLSKFFDAEDDVVLLNEDDIKELVSSQTWIHGTKIDRGTDKINIVDNSCSSNCYGRYMIPLPSSIKSLESLEIDIFSKYPTNSHKSHQVGLIDTDNRTFASTETADKYEYQKTLAYSKKESSDSSLQIITIKRNQEDITTDNAFSYDTINQKLKTTNAFNKDYKYETIIKYHNDNLYIEEYNPRAANASPNRKQELQTDNQYNYMTQTWQEEDE